MSGNRKAENGKLQMSDLPPARNLSNVGEADGGRVDMKDVHRLRKAAKNNPNPDGAEVEK